MSCLTVIHSNNKGEKTMKKLLSLLLVLVLVFTFAGCGERTKNKDGIDIEYYLSVGEIQGAEFKLGTKLEDIENAKLEHIESATGEGNHDHGEAISLVEGVVSKHYVYGPYHYYYNKNNADKGISFIAAFDTAYGFTVGTTTKAEVVNALGKLKYTEAKADDNELFFAFISPSNCEKVVLTKDNKELTFYFGDGILMFVTICNTENWSLNG